MFEKATRDNTMHKIEPMKLEKVVWCYCIITALSSFWIGR